MADQMLPVVAPTVADQCWDCHSCTRCCRELVVHLTDADRRRIDDQGWTDRLDARPYVRLGRQWALNKRGDGACVFLADDGKCRIHTAYGYPAKPLACRLYPFSLAAIDGAWRVAWRFDCPSMTRARGRPIAEHRPTLARLCRELSAPHTDTGGSVLLKRKRPATSAEVDTLVDHADAWLSDEQNSLHETLVGLIHLVQTLDAANVSAVRDDRFLELVQLLAAELPSAVKSYPTDDPTPRQQALFRQHVFAHTECLTLDEFRSTRTRIARRFRQLRSSRAFRLGHGPVPLPADPAGVVRFDEVARIAPAVADGIEVAAIVRRFLRMRVLSRHHFGRPYNDWPALDGLRALCASTAVVGWLARHAACRRGGAEIAVEDLVTALAGVDGALARPTALATAAERLRLAYLAQNQGLARLIWQWRLTEPA